MVISGFHKMGTDMHRIALIRTHVKPGVLGQYTVGDTKGLVGAQYGSRKPAALHLRQLVNQHVARSNDFALEPQAAAEQKRLAERAAIGEFWEGQRDGFNAGQASVTWISVVR